MSFFYILYSEPLDRFYYGSSNDPVLRLKKHNCATKGYTSKGQPWVLVVFERNKTLSAARERDPQWEKWKTGTGFKSFPDSFNI